jgi:hypothetical protein
MASPLQARVMRDLTLENGSQPTPSVFQQHTVSAIIKSSHHQRYHAPVAIVEDDTANPRNFIFTRFFHLVAITLR